MRRSIAWVTTIGMMLTILAGVAPAFAAGAVVINEIHYNPDDIPDYGGDDEFLELYNPGDAPYDLSGHYFEGFDLVFDNGTSLPAGAYVIVSPSITIAQTEFGVTPIAEFAAGGLSGGGELIQLLAPDDSVVDEVSYLDVAPWPGGPDGNGPSLELINPGFDNSLPASWLPSDPDPTPAAENSVFSEVQPPAITNINLTPPTPQPGSSTTVSADIEDGNAPTLTYKVMFDNDVVISMSNVGGDTWQATIPAQSAGELIRYRIDDDSISQPPSGDTRTYLGTVVDDPDTDSSDLPIFKWFILSSDFARLLDEDDLLLTDTFVPAVVAFGGEVYDGAQVRVRGQTSRFGLKKNFKFELPSGYELIIPQSPYPVDEFAIQADYGDWTFTGAQIAWEALEAAGEPHETSFFMRVEQNGDFFGLYRYQELYDGTWRDENGYADGELFKADGGWHNTPGFEKKNPDDLDFTSIQIAQTILDGGPSAAKTAWLYENVDIPDMINYLAASALIRQGDQRSHNFYVHVDGDTGRYSQVFWDLDLTWRLFPPSRCSDDDMRTIECVDSELMNAIWEVSEFRDMYWRRLQTMTDDVYSGSDLEDRREELLSDVTLSDANLEQSTWGRSNIVTSNFQRDAWNDAISDRRAIWASESRLPGSQSSSPSVVINELHYHPVSGSEFLELYNPSAAEAVDISGWLVDGIGADPIPAGTVLLPQSYAVLVSDDVAFRADYMHSVLTVQQYGGALSNGGETITLFDADDNVVDVVSYDDADPWPTEPDGDGPSLALDNPSLDNSNAANWAPSEGDGGTPGLPNMAPTGGAGPVVVHARGDQGDETMEVAINGGAATTFTNIATSFQTYPVPFGTGITSVRVSFTNNGPSGSPDRNLTVDKIVVGGVTYQTEDPSVFGSAVFDGSSYCEQGNFETETLYCNGYFEYPIDDGDPPGDEDPPVFSDLTLTVDAVAQTSFSVSWQPADDDSPVTYDVMIGPDAPVNVPDTNYTATGLSADTTYAVSVLAIDQAGNVSTSGPIGIVTTLAIPNLAPELATIGDQGPVVEGDSLSVPISATDNENDPITLSKTSGPDFVTVSDSGNGSGTLDINPGPGDAGNYSVTVQAAATGGIDSETFDVTIEAVNQAPELALIGDQGPVVEGESLSVPISATDDENDPITLSKTSGPDFVTVSDSGNGSGTLDINPLPGDAGTYSVTVQAAALGGVDSETFDVQIIDEPEPGVVTFLDATTGESGGTESDLSIDIPGGVVAGDVLVAAIAVGNNVLVTPPGGWSTAAEILTAAGSDRALQIFTKVANASEPGAFVFSSNSNEYQSGAILAARGVDSANILDVAPITGLNENSSTFAIGGISPVTAGAGIIGAAFYTKGDADAPFSISGDGIAKVAEVGPLFARNLVVGSKVSATPGSSGPFDVSFGVGTQDGAFALIALRPSGGSPVNQPPAIDQIGPIPPVLEGTSVTVDVTANDPEEDPIELALIDGPSFVTLEDNNDGTATLTIAPGVGTGGTYSVTVEASAIGGTDSDTFPVEVAVAEGPITTVGVSTAAHGNESDSLVLDVPGGTVANDVLYAVVSVGNDLATSVPDGWVILDELIVAAGQDRAVAVLRRVADGTEPASYSFSIPRRDQQSGFMISLRGVDTSSPEDAAPVLTAVDNTSTWETPQIANPSNGALVLAVGMYSRAGSEPYSISGSAINQIGAITQKDANLVFGAKTEPTAGLSGPFTVAFGSGKNDGASILIAVRPASP